MNCFKFLELDRSWTAVGQQTTLVLRRIAHARIWRRPSPACVLADAPTSTRNLRHHKSIQHHLVSHRITDEATLTNSPTFCYPNPPASVRNSHHRLSGLVPCSTRSTSTTGYSSLEAHLLSCTICRTSLRRSKLPGCCQSGRQRKPTLPIHLRRPIHSATHIFYQPRTLSPTTNQPYFYDYYCSSDSDSTSSNKHRNSQPLHQTPEESLKLRSRSRRPFCFGTQRPALILQTAVQAQARGRSNCHASGH